MIRISRNIIKLIQGRNANLDDYRYYIIARHHYALKSGLFSLDEFCDILHIKYGYKSLHHKPGNDRARFKKKLATQLDYSILFSRLPDGRFRINSERSLLSSYNRGNNFSMWFELTDENILNSKKDFFDYCIGILLAGGKFRSNKNIAEQVGCTKRRIQLATARNHKNNTFCKQYNFIDTLGDKYKEIKKLRAIMYRVHGITTPRPVRSYNDYVIRLNAPNTYYAAMLSGVKGDRAQPIQNLSEETNINIYKKSTCRFIPRPITKNTRIKSEEVPTKKWTFNKLVYNLTDYIQDNSNFSNGFYFPHERAI